MTIYKGNQKIGSAYKGGTKIDSLYKGNVRVYHIKKLMWLAWYAPDNQAYKVYMNKNTPSTLKQYQSNNVSRYTNNPNNFNNNVVAGGKLYGANSSVAGSTIDSITSATTSSLVIKLSGGFGKQTRTFTRIPEQDIYV